MHFKQKSSDAGNTVDNYRHRGLRVKLANELRRKGIHDEKVLRAISIIPRHFMLDKAFEEWAYKDMAFPIEANQTISMPYTVALQSQLLEVKRGEKILEIGTGSGYQAAILHALGAKVYTIERQRLLFERTNKLFEMMNLHAIRVLYGDGFTGAARFAPFDKIVVTAGSATFPDNLFDQLKIGGIMVIPLGRQDQKMMRYFKITDKSKRLEDYGSCAFVPMLAGKV